MSVGVAAPRLVDAVERVAARAGSNDELLESVASFWHGEFHEHDVNLFADLAREAVPAASLDAATNGRVLRSARYRDFIQPQGYDDELRTVFRTGGRPWGVAALFREKGRKPFDDAEVALVAAVSDVVASAIRARAAMNVAPTGLGEAPGLLLFDDDGILVSANATAARWLTEIHGDHETDHWVAILAERTGPDIEAAVPIVPLLARARAVACGRDGGRPRLRLRDRNGRWVVLHASVLGGPAAGGTVAVVVEPAKGAEIAPIIIEAYGLTPRERDVVRALARGTSTPDIASELYLSAHTVRDYIKSVFEKVGVSSRGELVAKLFAEHYADDFHADLLHID